MAKFTYRFHYRSWVDITVEADSEEEASIIALDRYNNGDYEDDSSEFENTHTELLKD